MRKELHNFHDSIYFLLDAKVFLQKNMKLKFDNEKFPSYLRY